MSTIQYDTARYIGYSTIYTVQSKLDAKSATDFAILEHESSVENAVRLLGPFFAVRILVDARKAQLARLGASAHDVRVASTIRSLKEDEDEECSRVMKTQRQ